MTYIFFVVREEKIQILLSPAQLEQPIMLLRNSISSTKKFFQKTLKGFKSFFSGDHYQRLPQTPPYSGPYSYNTLGSIDHMNIQTSYKDLDRFYTDFTNQWDSDKEKQKKPSNKKNTMSSSPLKQEKEIINRSFRKFVKASPSKNNDSDQMQRSGNHHQYYKMRKVENDGKRQEDSCSSMGTREERSCLLAEKLKELEKMDMSNVDHLLDIEEVLHYYSRLTCPAYLDIVDKFFMEMYVENLAPSSTASSHINSRPNLRSVRS